MKNCTLLLVLAAIAGTGTLRAQVPQIINYQGRVVVGTTNFNGTGQFKFALVNAAGTTTYWSNDGTSTAGSQPTNAVSLTVSKGLYSVLLGDTTVANMTVAIPLSVFNNSDVRLRVWFNDGTTGSQLLAPDQRIASVGYANMAANIVDGAITSAKMANGAIGSAQIANGAVGSAQIASGGVGATQIANSSITAAKVANAQVVKSVNGLTDALTLAAGSNMSITPSGNTLTLASTGGPWLLNGTNAYYNAGRVALGTTTPSHQLTIATTGVTPAWTTSQWAGALSLDNGAAIGWQANAGGWRFGMGHTGNGFLVFRTNSDPGNNANPAIYDFSISDAGNVGIGTTTPASKLHILSGAADLPPRLQSSGTTSFAAGLDLYLGSTGKGYIGVPDASAVFAPGEMLVFGGANTPLSLWANQTRALTIDTSGNVGIGTTSPQTKVHLVDSGSVSERIETTGGTNAWAKVEFVNANGQWAIGTSRGYNGDEFYISRDGLVKFEIGRTGDVTLHDILESNAAITGRTITATGPDAGFVGTFTGDVYVTGTLYKGAGSFKIDHPLDPANKYLSHSFVESPDMMNVYNGNVTTDSMGHAAVELPDWFEALNKDFRYQLTVMGEQFAQVRVSSKIKDNRFTIQTDKAFVEVSWQVTGIRKDAFAEAHRIQVEEAKPPGEQGRYLHPELYGQPESKRLDYTHRERPKRGSPDEQAQSPADQGNGSAK